MTMVKSLLLYKNENETRWVCIKQVFLISKIQITKKTATKIHRPFFKVRTLGELKNVIIM